LVFIKQVVNADAGDVDHVGGDDWDNFDKYFSAALDVLSGDVNSQFRIRDNKFQFRNPANTFHYLVRTSAIVANRDITIPLLTGNDIFVFEAFAATITNKTLALGSNTISGTAAEFNTAVTDDTFFYISNNISNMATSTSAQFDAANSDGTFVLNADNISALAASSVAQYNTSLTGDSFMTFASTNVVTGAIRITAGTMRIPLSATPTMAVDGDFAIDTTVTDFSHGIMKYFDGEEVGVVAMPIAQFGTPSDGFVVSYNATNDEFELVAAGVGDALTTNPLSQFAATTSAQLLGVISNETGTGLLVFGTSPTIVTPTIASFVNATHDHSNAAGGGLLTTLGTITTGVWQGTAVASAFLDADTQHLSVAQTITGAKTYQDDKLLIQNPAATFSYTITAAAIAAARILNLPLTTATDTLMTLGLAQTVSGALTLSAVLTMSGANVDLAGNDLDNTQNLILDQSVSGTDIDFNEDQQQTISIAANTTFTGVNYAIGKSKTVFITTDGTLRTLTFPAGWIFQGAKPADQAASKVGTLTLTSTTAAEAGIRVAYAVQA